MNAVNPLRTKCDAAGFDFNKLPQGATDIKSNNDGTFTITVDGKPTQYNKDGSVFNNPPASNNTPVNNNNNNNNNGTPQGNSANNNENISVFNGQGNSNADMTITNVNGNYNIDPNLFMGSAMTFDASTQMASNTPFGLGSVFGQGSIAASLQNFLKSVSFNFDFSAIRIQREQQQQAQAAANEGYNQTGITGVYEKDGKYYKYDSEKNEYTQCNADGTELTAEQKEKAVEEEEKKVEETKAQEEAKATKKTKAEEEAAAITEQLFDAMKGAGTKNNQLQTTVNSITKDNVIEIFDAWDTNFADSMDNETLIESIQNEHYTGWFGNSQEKEEMKIVDALYARAMDLGLKNEAAACRAKVKAEHSAWFTSDETVKDAIITLVNQIKCKEAGVEYVKPEEPKTE